MSKNLAEKFVELEKLVEEARPEVVSVFEKTNKAAARRARKHLMSVAKLCKELRADITEAIK